MPRWQNPFSGKWGQENFHDGNLRQFPALTPSLQMCSARSSDIRFHARLCTLPTWHCLTSDLSSIWKTRDFQGELLSACTKPPLQKKALIVSQYILKPSSYFQFNQFRVKCFVLDPSVPIITEMTVTFRLSEISTWKAVNVRDIGDLCYFMLTGILLSYILWHLTLFVWNLYDFSIADRLKNLAYLPVCNADHFMFNVTIFL